MQPNAIEIRNLHKSFGSHPVLKGLDLDVPAGSIFALLGPNGAGKTTLIHILATLVIPDQGTARVAGSDTVSQKNDVKRAISLTGQFAAVDDMLTGEENLVMIGRLSGLSSAEAKARAAELSEQFELNGASRKRVKTYSGGMRRRLDLAASLISPRPILFLDEPTTGLDTSSRRALWDIILHLAKQGITVFLTTQYLEEADQLADCVAVLAGGRIIANGSPAELKSRVGGEVIELVNGSDEVVHALPTSGRIADVQRQLAELLPSLPHETRVRLRAPSMDDVFVALTAMPKEAMSV
ncbi:ATP-binding cassette domain-containing protein [Paenibacillus methanolicus]|uniref:ABC-2 type transport system ATP-binding protein n=1 Tax=Paenibacillus methanolicus TaxID=582686 RepID=A0A5S5C636_9BACL|nr:ATP-binding cassette domain-containing protein [Paenibacillus methanolicus]TYP74058.1 ABC-2 type transport system ATP-binding protein [Paenibacillus methanolicus]